MRVGQHLLLLLILSAPLMMTCGGSDSTPTASPTVAPPPTATPTPAPTPSVTAVPVPSSGVSEMEIDSIRPDPTGAYGIVLLREKESGRYLAIWIGLLEAAAIAEKLQGLQTPRPLTHDLLDSIIKDLGGRVAHVIITDLLGDTFHAKIVLTRNGDLLEVDARPSDAIALALRAEVPVYAHDSVLDVAGFELGPLNGESQEAPGG